MLFATLPVQADFVLVAEEAPIHRGSPLTETYWEAVVAPNGKYDRIGLHRYHNPHMVAAASVLYLPGTNMNGELSIRTEDHNLWLYLAARGIAVYTVDYRTHFVPNEPVPDLSFMQGWTLGAFVDDLTLAVDFVRNRGDKPLFVAGFSRGVSYAYALAGQREFDGLIALDGSFKQFRPAGFDRAAAMAKLAETGQWGTVLSRSRGWASRDEMMRRTWENPAGPAMGNFPTIGDQLTSTLYNAWGRGGLANPVDGVSSIAVLAQAMQGYDRTFPAVQNIEGQSIATQADDPATNLDDHFGKMTLPILYFGATNLGADNLMNGIYSANYSGSRNVTINVLENYGHVDVLYADGAIDQVYEVTRRWIDELLGEDQ
ncbi:MAG: alpha/beta hydrolase [Pseudomonadota bacterium]